MLFQTRDNARRTWVSYLIEPRLFSKEKFSSLPRSLRHFNKVRVASPLQRPRLFSILWLVPWQNKRAGPLFPKRVTSLLWSKFTFVTPRVVFLHQAKGASSLWRKLAPWQKSRAAFLQQREVCIPTSMFVLLQESESSISTSMFASLQWMRVAFLFQTRSTSLRQHDLCIYKTCVQSLFLQSVQQYTGKSRWLFPLVQQYTDRGKTVNEKCMFWNQ